MESVTGAFLNTSLAQSLKLSLDAAAMRHQAITSNLAHVNTPGYQRVDLSPQFQTEFTRAMEQLQGGQKVSELPKPSLLADPTAGEARYDGNNVNMDNELVSLMQNQTHYDFSAKMLAQHYRSIRSAISGRPN